MRAIVFLLFMVATASADTTYQVDPNSRVTRPASTTTKRCGDEVKKSLDQIVQTVSQIKLATDAVYYRLVGGEFVKATTSVDNYGFIKNGATTIVLAVYPRKVMDAPRAADARNEVMIAVIKRQPKGDCSERWFGFAKAVTP